MVAAVAALAACSDLETVEVFYPDGTIKEKGTLRTSPEGKKLRYGKWTTFHSDGNIHLEGYYRDNLLDGRMFEYTSNGQTVAQRQYNLGKKHGKHELWFKSGRPREIVTYLNDRPHGRMRTWYETGFQRKDETYDNGVLDGVSVEYYDNGRIMRRVVYRAGKCEGENFLYSKKGVLINRNTCKNGKIDGIQYVYHTDGSTLSIQQFQDGLQSGDKSLYYRSGELLARFTFEDDKETQRTCYSKQGEVVSCKEFSQTKGWTRPESVDE